MPYGKDAFLLFSILFAGVFDSGADDFRLPDSTRPVSYDVAISPQYGGVSDAFEFAGEVEIVVSVKHATSNITLNCKGLAVDAVYVYENETESSIDVYGWRIDNRTERMTIVLESDLDANVVYVMNIEFRGTVESGMDGFYESTYRGQDGYKEWLLLTYFEPTGARRIFPCYDEPAYKTPYKISLTRPNDKFARSNMPLDNSATDHKLGKNEMTDYFAETPPMSTHMVAFVISGLSRSPNGSDTRRGGGGGGVSVFARPDCSDQVRYVSGEAPELLRAMEEFAGVPYELPGLDLFAVPDLKSDATGNWGLATFREKYLLLDNASSAKDKESGLSVVQREMARQWFGNSVTCSWWDYVWLHDAFAAYFQYFTLHTVHPEWRMDETFVVERHQPALAYDQTPRRPITASVRTAAEIDVAFHDRTPAKAAAFLRMLKHATNDTVFQQSLVRYLKLNEHGSAEPGDLFAAFEHTVAEYQYDFGPDVSVTSFMQQWTERPGYPVIDVVKVNGTFVVTQERFLIDDRTAADPTEWPVPITYTTEASANFDDLAPAAWCKPDAGECVLTAPQDAAAGWFIFNLRSAGFYRVNYDADNWESLIRQLREAPTTIHVLNRAQLIDDSFNLARAGKLNYSVPFKLSSYLNVEDDVLPWYSVIDGYSYLLERMRRDDTEYLRLRECVSDLAGTIFKKTDEAVRNNTDHVTLKSWNAISVWTCALNNTICTQTAFEYYKKWRNGENIPADIRDAALCTGIRATNETSSWERMFEFYKTTNSSSEKQSAQSALACTEDDSLLSRYLNYIFVQEDGPIRSQDFNDVFTAVSSTSNGLNVLIDFLVQNVNKIAKQNSDGEDTAIFIYSICASKSALDTEIIKIKNLKDNPDTPENLREAFNETYYSLVENNLHWYNEYHEIVNVNTEKCSAMLTTIQKPMTDITYTSTEHYTTEGTTTEEPITNTTYKSTEYYTTKGSTTEEPKTNTTYTSTVYYTTKITTTEEPSTVEPHTNTPTIYYTSEGSTTEGPQTNTTYTSTVYYTTKSTTTEEPSTEEPLTNTPTVYYTTERTPEEPSTVEPHTNTPTVYYTTERTTTKEPPTEEPLTNTPTEYYTTERTPEEPSTVEPHTNTPTVYYTTERTTTKEPPTEEPLTNTPTVYYTTERTPEEPSTVEPRTNTPTVYYTTKSTTTEEPSTEEPLTNTPTVYYTTERTPEEPSTVEPHTNTPTVYYTTERTTTKEPPTEEPLTNTPTVYYTTERTPEEPSTVEPRTNTPTVYYTTKSTTTEEPSTEEPLTNTPTVYYTTERTPEEPSTVEPHTNTPTVYYTTERTTTKEPPTEEPLTNTPTVYYTTERTPEEPSTVEPHTNTPTIYYTTKSTTTEEPKTNTTTVYFTTERTTTKESPTDTTYVFSTDSSTSTTTEEPLTNTPTVYYTTERTPEEPSTVKPQTNTPTIYYTTEGSTTEGPQTNTTYTSTVYYTTKSTTTEEPKTNTTTVYFTTERTTTKESPTDTTYVFSTDSSTSTTTEEPLTNTPTVYYTTERTPEEPSTVKPQTNTTTVYNTTKSTTTEEPSTDTTYIFSTNSSTTFSTTTELFKNDTTLSSTQPSSTMTTKAEEPISNTTYSSTVTSSSFNDTSSVPSTTITPAYSSETDIYISMVTTELSTTHSPSHYTTEPATTHTTPTTDKPDRHFIFNDTFKFFIIIIVVLIIIVLFFSRDPMSTRI